MNAPLQVELRDCTNLTKGKPPAQQPYYGADSARYLTPEYLRGSATCESAKPSSNAVYIKDGETILLWDGSNAGEVFLGREGILASTMTLVSPDSRFTPDYFFFALKRWESFLKGQTSGSGIPHVDKEVLEKLEITEFAEPEQSKIAEVLSTVDRAIAQTEALIAKQQRIKTGLMQDLLTRGIDEHGQLRSEATHAFKDSPLGRIPVDWEVVPLEQIASVSGGKRLPAGHSYAEGRTGYVYLRVLDFFNRKIDLDSLVSLDPDTFEALERYEIRDGELCISIAGSLGYVSVLRLRNDMRAILTENALRIVPGCNIDADYLCMAMNGLAVQSQVEALKGTGGGVPKLALHRVKSLLVAFPHDQSEQQRINDFMSAYAKSTWKASQIRQKLRSLKTALMQDLLTGKVRVTPLLQQAEAVTA